MRLKNQEASNRRRVYIYWSSRRETFIIYINSISCSSVRHPHLLRWTLEYLQLQSQSRLTVLGMTTLYSFTGFFPRDTYNTTAADTKFLKLAHDAHEPLLWYHDRDNLFGHTICSTHCPSHDWPAPPNMVSNLIFGDTYRPLSNTVCTDHRGWPNYTNDRLLVQLFCYDT